MRPRPTDPIHASRGPALAVLAAFVLVATACGGGSDGGDGGGVTIPDTVVFTGNASTISMAPGASVGPAFDVDVLYNNVSDLNGVALNISFDSSRVRFVGIFTAESTLGEDAQFFGGPVEGTTNEIALSGALPAGASVAAGPSSGTLLTVQFEATNVGTSSLTVPPNGAIVTRRLTNCPTPATCTDLPIASGDFTGGTVEATAGP